MKKFYFFITILLFNSCASIILPRKQKVTINTNNKESVVYANDLKIGKGQSFTKKLKKSKVQQLVVQTPNYKDTYYCLSPIKRPAAYWPLRILSIPTIYGAYLDGMTPNTVSYPKIIQVPPIGEYKKRTETEKYIDVESITVDIKDVKKDIKHYYVSIGNGINLTTKIDEEIKIQDKERNTDELKKEKKRKKKNEEYLTKEDENKIKIDNTIFSEIIAKNLKKSGYIDTVNKVFSDNNNTLILQGTLTKVATITLKKQIGVIPVYFSKVKIWMTWYYKNCYGEILDSLNTTAYSGDFKDYDLEKMLTDAVETSSLNLFNLKTFKNYLIYENKIENPSKKITIKNTNNYITELGDATDASVIIKLKEGHGSGFAVGNDGYIITNYHVIAGKKLDKFDPIKVILSNGEEYVATIVQYNRYQDIALLKIDKKFDKVFKIPATKNFKNMQDVLTIGTPKSIELGQSIASGIISNERKVNNNLLIQLNMSVNSGNSGGPLMDKSAQLQGVIVSKLFGLSTEGVCFAIPGYKIKEYLNLDIRN